MAASSIGSIWHWTLCVNWTNLPVGLVC